MENNLWYHYSQDQHTVEVTPTIRCLSTRVEFELWHHRLGHPNATTLQRMHKYAWGVQKLVEPAFYKCQTCAAAKVKKYNAPPNKQTQRLIGFTYLLKHLYLPTECVLRGREEQGEVLSAFFLMFISFWCWVTFLSPRTRPGAMIILGNLIE